MPNWDEICMDHNRVLFNLVMTWDFLIFWESALPKNWVGPVSGPEFLLSRCRTRDPEMTSSNYSLVLYR